MSPRAFKFPTPVGKVVKKLSKLLRIQRQAPTHPRPISPSPLAAIPVDVMEEILLWLPGQDIVRMKQVRQHSSHLKGKPPGR